MNTQTLVLRCLAGFHVPEHNRCSAGYHKQVSRDNILFELQVSLSKQKEQYTLYLMHI